jgi:negative regulator of sigma E activity
MVAGRSSVILRVQRGNLSKELSIDRETGVVLRMVTTDHRREVSRMVIQHITYEPVTVTPCPPDAETAMKPVSHPEVSTILGRQAVEPRWLPDGMTARGTFREWCNCCQQEMVVLRYADGVRTLTLFEGAGHHQCAMAAGCHMASSGSAYVEARRVGRVTVTAVGDVDRETLANILRSLQ